MPERNRSPEGSQRRTEALSAIERVGELADRPWVVAGDAPADDRIREVGRGVADRLREFLDQAAGSERRLAEERGVLLDEIRRAGLDSATDAQELIGAIRDADVVVRASHASDKKEDLSGHFGDLGI